MMVVMLVLGLVLFDVLALRFGARTGNDGRNTWW